MTSLQRHVRSVLALPFLVAVVIPAWLAWRDGLPLTLGASRLLRFTQLLGLALLGTGLTWFAGALRRFAGDGQGTLAPWDPPQRLVVSGLYRYVRNPMITGVALVLFGEAALLLSRAHLGWALAFVALNAILIPAVEEPQLARRFGEPYREYCRNVPRLIPRRRPWMPG